MIKLSKKDRSLILFIASSIVVLWAIFSFFSYIFFNATSRNSDINKIITAQDQEWFNVANPLTVEDLKDRVILLDFWTYACVNCLQALPTIKAMEKEYGKKLVVIGVHSGKFDNEKESSAIRKAILKHDIDHPVVNDANHKIWDNFAVKAWPTFILLNVHGNVIDKFVGESSLPDLEKAVKKAVSKYKYEVSRVALPTLLEKANLIGNVLDFPTKLEYVADFSYKSHHNPALFIANSGANNIIVSSLSGDIIAKIGSGIDGFNNGNFDSASFREPQGLLYHDNKLYVADTGNHALRVIDFKEGKISTLIGSSQKGGVILGNATLAKNVDLSSPTALKFFPDKDHIVIANSGSHQILSYDLKNHTIHAIAGNGAEGIIDGPNPQNSLAQTADLAVFNKKLYFVDSESSSLRVLDEKGNVETLIGQDLFKFGYANGNKDQAIMQHPLGLVIDDSGIYITDSFNHRIRKYSLSGKTLSDFYGSGKRGDAVGKSGATEFDEPEGIVSAAGRLYIADSNNNRIVAINKANLSSEIIDVMPPLKLPKEGFLEYLPNLQQGMPILVKTDAEIMLKVNLKEGWKINEQGPSFINLLELTQDNQANLIATFDWQMIKSKNLKLPRLKEAKNYVLQGVVYYCENKQNALCYVKSYQQDVNVGGDAIEIEVKLGY